MSLQKRTVPCKKLSCHAIMLSNSLSREQVTWINFKRLCSHGDPLMSNKRRYHTTAFPCGFSSLQLLYSCRGWISFNPVFYKFVTSTVATGWGEKSQTRYKHEKSKKKSHFPRKTGWKETPPVQLLHKTCSSLHKSCTQIQQVFERLFLNKETNLKSWKKSPLTTRAYSKH